MFDKDYNPAIFLLAILKRFEMYGVITWTIS